MRVGCHPCLPPNNNKLPSQQMLTGAMFIINEFDESSLGSEHDSPFSVPRPRIFAGIMLLGSRGPRIQSSRIKTPI